MYEDLIPNLYQLREVGRRFISQKYDQIYWYIFGKAVRKSIVHRKWHLNPATIMSLSSLPAELIEQILLYLHPFEIVECRQVCLNGVNCDVANEYARTPSYTNGNI
jgi:hypothetical protein